MLRLRLNIFIALAVIVSSLWAPVLPSAHAVASTSNATPVYRFYKLQDGSHFYTASENEKSQVMTHPDIYRYEGISFYTNLTQVVGSVPVYRFYNFRQGVHFYTSNQAEATSVNNNLYQTYRFEGVIFYSFPTQVTNSAQSTASTTSDKESISTLVMNPSI